MERDEIKRWMMAALTWSLGRGSLVPFTLGSLDRVCPVLSPPRYLTFYFILVSSPFCVSSAPRAAPVDDIRSSSLASAEERSLSKRMLRRAITAFHPRTGVTSM